MRSVELENLYPERIVCLTEETTELLYLLGEEDRIVGISGFTMRPRRARKEKPKVSTFLDANTDEILDLKPDLVIGFSDIQADIARNLIAEGITVWVNNHRSVGEILKFMYQLGNGVGKGEEVKQMILAIQGQIDGIIAQTKSWKERPRVYFEEWYDPLISGIQWVSEIIEIAGGDDIFPEKGRSGLAKDRIIANPDEVVDKDPQIILASWCGKMFKKDQLVSRAGWENITAVAAGDIHEIKSEIILQPGPAALMDGIPLVHQILEEWHDRDQ